MFTAYYDKINLSIPKNSVIYTDSIRYSYIQICIILDELEILNGLAKNDEYLKDTLYVISPAVRALKKFTGLKKARNYIFAHFNRSKKKSSILGGKR